MDKLKFAILILVSEMLLAALATAWFVHMVIIAKDGAIYFVKPNPTLLQGEIAAIMLIILFAAAVFALQINRLEKDEGEMTGEGAMLTRKVVGLGKQHRLYV